MSVAAFRPGRRGAESTSKDAAPCGTCAARSLTFCSVLEGGELDALGSMTKPVNLAPRQSVFLEDEPAEHIFNVTEGVVRVYKSLADGRRQITGFLFRGDFLGLSANENYVYGAEAVTRVSLCRFPRGKLERLLVELPKLEKRFLGMALDELAAAQDQMLLLGRKSAQERVSSFLLMVSRRLTGQEGPSGPIDLPMSRTDTADYLGLSMETVSRTFSRLKKQGVIAFEANGPVQIIDGEALEDLGAS